MGLSRPRPCEKPRYEKVRCLAIRASARFVVAMRNWQWTPLRDSLLQPLTQHFIRQSCICNNYFDSWCVSRLIAASYFTSIVDA